MKGMEFASSGGDEKAAAFGDALAESALDEPDAEEQDVAGEILNITSHGGSGELPISAMALLAVVERGLYCSQSAQNIARRAAAP